jgi:hypothetical protein
MVSFPFRGVNLQLALRANYTVNLLICELLPGMVRDVLWKPEWEPVKVQRCETALL